MARNAVEYFEKTIIPLNSGKFFGAYSGNGYYAVG